MSRPCMPVLEDLPPRIAEQIVDDLDLISRIRVRKTCRNFRDAVDDSRIEFNSIFLCFSADKILLSVSQDSKNQLIYSKHPLGCLVKFEKKEKIINGGDYLQCAMTDFRSFIKSPKATLKELVLANKDGARSREYLEAFKSALRSTDHQLAVGQLHLISDYNQEDIVDLLTCFKPGTLEEIALNDQKKALGSFEKITSMEQWKQAKRADVEVENVLIDDFLHFENLVLKTKTHFSTEDAKKVVEAALHHPGQFKSFSISAKSLDASIIDYLSPIADADHDCAPFCGPRSITHLQPPIEHIKFISIPNTTSCLAARWGKENQFYVGRFRREKKCVWDGRGNDCFEFWLNYESYE